MPPVSTNLADHGYVTDALDDHCTADTKQASHAALSREIKKHVTIPVATVGRINEAWIAEELIEDGAADICMMGRAGRWCRSRRHGGRLHRRPPRPPRGARG